MGESIRFSQRCEPPLKAGTYRIQVEQVTSINCRLASENTDFKVTSERFFLSPDQIYSVYPPREAVGNYAECLPHIVLNRRTLPWERALLKGQSHMPWLALLVFDETEDIRLHESTVGKALQAEAGVYVPSLLLEEHEKPEDPCTYVHIPTKLLSELLPYPEALSLLAHGKGVSLDRKVTDAAVKDDWFATVVTNRFCLEPDEDRQIIRHTACLVSLEGYETCLASKQSRIDTLANVHTARMIVLANWHFSMARRDFDYGSAFASLDAAMLSTPYHGNNEQIQRLCRLGYYPMNQHVRDGSQVVSWYQSPLVPYDEPKKTVKSVRFADQLLAYDPELGMMDIRYSSAWQIGRSMALSDQSYAQKLYSWRQSNETLARTSVYQGLLSMHLSSPLHDKGVRDWEEQRSIGYSFVKKARDPESTGSQASAKKILIEQLNERYKTLLNEVVSDASPDGLG
ncbi:hypothetical protein [Paenibacillus tarimensis]|uniref:hypothetical protein n=1 Tax=Paenibacillus tarimensis TaxID=416012 RepID=UPI001F2A4648|nr:hypothetical protein [Paenibacillus tarimensis]MCF2942794.1 hypothetical protein [Paenibacillus tarimensis]